MAPRLTPVDWKTLEKVFLKAGFQFERQKGSHRSYTKAGVLRPIVIPTYSDISPDIITNNLRTAGISREQYLAWLND